MFQISYSVLKQNRLAEADWVRAITITYYVKIAIGLLEILPGQ
jgi:hypothetical protein